MRIEDRLMDLSPEEGARRVALGLLSDAVEAAEALAAGKGDEPLHDFRVAVRRLRSALRTYRPWLAEGVRPRHERRLKRIARSTNEARDAEVQLAWLAPRRDALSSPAHLAGHGLAVARFEARLHSGPDAARVTARFGRIAEKLGRRLEWYERRVAPAGEEGPSYGSVLASLVEDQVNALVARVEAVRDAADVEGAHRARIEGKRLRYLLEPLRGYPRADAAEAVSALKRLQDVLGELHDAHVLGGELGAGLVEVSAERARLLHVAALSPGGDSGLREQLRGSPRPGLLALVRLVRERRDALFADLEREWRAGGLAALAGQVRGLADAVEARAGGRLEHERKFLLAALPPRAESAEAVEIVQGWLPGARLRERIRRARRAGVDHYFRAVKRGSGGSRLEAEEETTREVFETLWPLTEGRRIAKRRHRVRDGDYAWEIDVFTDRDLVLAEVELPARSTELELPEWLRPLALRDVTDDPAFRNENLAAAPHADMGAPVEADSARAAPPAGSGEPPPAPAPG